MPALTVPSSRAVGLLRLGQSRQGNIALDLKSPADKAIFEKLLAKADVLVENFRPGTMEKLGYRLGNASSKSILS